MRRFDLLFCLISFGFLLHSAVAQVKINITQPQEGAKFEICSDIEFKVDATKEGGEIKKVLFFLNNLYVKSDQKAPFEYVLKNAPSGNYTTVVRAQDEQANEFVSDPVHFKVGEPVPGNLLLNGEFDCQIWPWYKSVFAGATANTSIETDSWLSGENCVFIDVQHGGNADYDLWFLQGGFPLINGHTYEVSFMADALQDKNISVVFKHLGGFETYWSQAVTVSGQLEYGPYLYISEVDDSSAALQFNVGGEAIPIYLDAVKLIDLDAEDVQVEAEPIVTCQEFQLQQNYPNPFNASTVIEYQLSQPAFIHLQILNLNGQVVRTLAREEQAMGPYFTEWDSMDDNRQPVASGVYLYRLTVRYAEKQIQTFSRKLVLMQ